MKRILTCNIGNTNIQIANWVDNKIEKVIQFATYNLGKQKLRLMNPEGVFTACTVPDIAYEWKRIVQVMLGIRVYFIGKDDDFGMKIQYKGKMGQDRIADIAAGYKIAGSNFIVIDFGTATTLDVVIDSEYRGGLIFTGIDLGLRALYRYTSLLPRINPEKADKIISKSTDECILSGAYWGEVARIECIVEKIRKEFGRNLIVLATGGLGDEVSKELGYRYDKWLTLRGIKYIADNVNETGGTT